MRLVPLALVASLALGPAAALARAWNGVTPGQSSQAEVLQRFGEPTKRTTKHAGASARTVLAYFGDQAPGGTRQAQFHVDGAGTVQEITVFLSVTLDAESIEGTYGKPPQKTFVEDTFQKVWVYPVQGLTVYFGKDGTVEALSFTAGKGRPAPAPGPDAAEPATAAATPSDPAAAGH